MSNIGHVPEELAVGRGDPAYMAHAYLTKVPVPAITPFVEAFTRPGDIVVDPFAGSGMTGVAAAILGRSARLSDISVLGQHIGRNFVNLVDHDLLAKYANAIVEASQVRLGRIYDLDCARCGNNAELAKSVWSIHVRCPGCRNDVNYYAAMEQAAWHKPAMVCPDCSTHISSRCQRVGETSVLDYVNCSCTPTQLEQIPIEHGHLADLEGLRIPDVEITPDRQMYKASALGKSGLTTVASYYSPRNLMVLADLRQRIAEIADEDTQCKLLFAFTACLTRASRRYQWSRARPLNAANANYYVAPVFYEWNVYDLFLRKIQAVIKADNWVIAGRRANGLGGSGLDVTYEIGSAAKIDLPDNSVDYVFTDPPFGSNLFYADMALFQEAWLDGFTDVDSEAVIDRSRTGTRTADKYEGLLTEALSECRRILKPGGRISMVFGNSSGRVWALVQRVVRTAGLRIEPESLVVLNKGQRSVKGLASGFEHVATLDLVLTMVEANPHEELPHEVGPSDIAGAVRQLASTESDTTPSHLYLSLLRHAIRAGWRLDQLDLRVVTGTLIGEGWALDSKSGRMLREQGLKPQPADS